MSSRGEVNLERTHTFLWSKKKWTGIPIMSANMDTVGTPSMHNVLSKHKLITCPAKHYLKNDSNKFFQSIFDKSLINIARISSKTK